MPRKEWKVKMKKIGFIGAYDKTDFLIYVAKILQILNYKILVVDTTSLQKTKFIVPAINPTKSYITNFENIDFAIGFETWEDIEKYLGIKFDSNDKELVDKDEQQTKNNDIYDYILIDIDTKHAFDNFEAQKNDNNYFVTGFDIYSIRRGMSILREINNPIKLIKILFSYHQTKEEEEYLDMISMEYNISWNEYTFYFNINFEDTRAIEENQRAEKIRFKKLSNSYKESLAYVVQDINKKESLSSIKRAMKE